MRPLWEMLGFDVGDWWASSQASVASGPTGHKMHRQRRQALIQTAGQALDIPFDYCPLAAGGRIRMQYWPSNGPME